MKKFWLSSFLVALFAIGFTASDKTEGLPEDPVIAGMPTIQILAPSSEGVFVTNEGSVEISGIASADLGLESITYVTNFGIEGTAEGLDVWKISNLKLEEGDNVIEVIATDNGKNTTSAKIVITKNSYLTFLSGPNVDNNLLYAGSPTELWITVGIAPNEKLVDGSVALFEVDEKGEEIDSICALFDNGILELGDEIKGDNVYSIKYTFNYETPGVKYFRIGGRTLEESGEVKSYSPVFTITVFDKEAAEQKIASLLEYKSDVEGKLADLINAGMLTEGVETAIMDWLKDQPFVTKVEKEGSVIKVDYINGLTSYVFVDSNMGVIKGGNQIDNRRNGPSVPLNLQTRGIWQQKAAARTTRAFKAPANKADVIQNKNVLIWSPFENNFVEDMEPVLGPIFNGSSIGFKVDYLKNDECTTASLQNLSSYGVVVLDSHGLLGNMILTRERAESFITFGSEEVYKDYIYQYVAGSYYLVTMAYYREDISKTVVETFYAVTPKFFERKIKNIMPNTIVFNGSCESLKNDEFADAFISKGAKTYLGFSSDITVYTCNNKAEQFFSALTSDNLKTTGESYIEDLNFTESYKTKSWTTSYLMKGSSNMRFNLGLINGDFEYGNLNGWNVEGDGRVITQLGFLAPTQGNYMGIISTGLGFTEKYGSIWQTFNVGNETTLSFKWNFLSEEFLEWVGSSYMDYLIVSIIDKEGNEEILFQNNIDQFAEKFEAAHGVQGNLIYVSPEIVFDRGDVYMTGWQEASFDISKYRGKTVTLKFQSGDVGDSVFDSATLLDEIMVY